jgi:O-antigen/teichoic acid export membrane protein
VTKVRSSLVLSMADSYVGLLLQIASTVIISRLLTPSEVGAFAIAAVFSALATTFRDFGVAEYLIQERELTHEKIRAALTMNILVSWSMALLLVLGSSVVSDFYREPGVGDVMRVLALNFILVPFGAVTHAWFRRELNFKPVFVCNLFSHIAAFVVSVALALNGFGTLSLAWGSFAGIVAVVVATWFFKPADFPFLPGFKGLAPVFHFGKFASLIYVFGQLGRGAPELIIGRALGAADVGLFSRAGGLTEMLHRVLLRPVLLICMPYFAGQDRDKGSIAPAYANSVSLLTAAGWPFLAVTCLLASPLIHLIYGGQWSSAVPLAQVLCLACALEILYLPSREAILASGDARRASTLQMQIVALQVLGLLASIPLGLLGACWGLVAAAMAGVALSHWQLHRLGARTGAMLQACWPSGLLTLISAGPLAAVIWFVPITQENDTVWLLLGGTACTLLWLAGLRALNHPLWKELMGYALRLLPARRN